MKLRVTNETRKQLRLVFWGLVLVLFAVVLILDGVGIQVGFGITPWRIIAGVLLLAWAIWTIIQLHFSDIFIPLAILFLVFEAPIAHAAGKVNDNLIPNWIVILAAVLLTIGFNILLKPIRSASQKGEQYDTTPGKIGNKAVYLDAEKLDGAVISDHMGSVQIFIKNAPLYTGSAVVTLSNNLGKVILHLPDDWDVVTQTGDNIGTVDIPIHSATSGKSVTLVIHDNMGNIQVVFETT